MSRKFIVEVIETYTRLVDVVAKDEAEALDKVRKAWRNSELVLGDEDFIDIDYQIFKEEK